MASATQVGDTGRAPGSWLQPDPALAGSSSQIFQEMEEVCLSLSLCCSAFQINECVYIFKGPFEKLHGSHAHKCVCLVPGGLCTLWSERLRVLRAPEGGARLSEGL